MVSPGSVDDFKTAEETNMSVSLSLPWMSVLILIAAGAAEPACTSQSDSKTKSHIKRLKEDLFQDYDSSVRPVRMRADRTEVAVEMIPLSVAFDEDYDEFTLGASIHFVWKDEFLVWNVSDYGGIKYIRLDGDSVWVPEVFHLSAWDITDLKGLSRVCSLYSSGWLHCWDHHSLKALCRLDLTNWPYDSQNCTVTLSTVSQSEEEIELMVMGAHVNLKEYIPNRTWKLLTVGYNQYSHIFGNRVFPCLQYYFLLRRNDVITNMAITVPIIVFVILLLSSFWLNTEQELRLNVCCTVFLCHIFLLHDIGHITNGDNTPLLGLFYRHSLVLCVLSLEFTIFMQKLNTASPRRVPHFVSSVLESGPARILLGLGRNNCQNQGNEILSDEKQDTGKKDNLPDSVTKWRLFGSLLNAVAADGSTSNKAKVKPHTVRLKDNLLCAYDKSVRPVVFHGSVTFVYVSMLLRSLTIDEDIGSLHIHCWMIWSWLDEKLQWKPSDYGGVDVLHVDSDEIWTPEIVQHGVTATWNARHEISKGRCMVEPGGRVTCVPTSVYSSNCAPNVTYWPYDVINCSLVIGAWLQTGDEITVNNNRGIVNLYHYEPNPAWKLLSATSTRHLEQLPGNSTFPWILYSFVLQRHAGMYEATVGIPALVLSSLVLISFWLPPLEENRINISCVSLICHCLYLVHLWWKLKNSGEKNPLIVKLFRDSMLLSGLSVLVAIILRRLSSTSTASPRWVTGIISWILSYRLGQLLLLAKLSPESAAVAEEETEGAVLVGTSTADGVHAWSLLGGLLNRVCFIIAALVYVFIFSWLTATAVSDPHRRRTLFV